MSRISGCLLVIGLILIVVITSVTPQQCNKSDNTIFTSTTSTYTTTHSSTPQSTTQTTQYTAHTYTTTTTSTTTQPPQEVELTAAKNQGIIEFTVYGLSTIDSIQLKLTSKSSLSLDIVVLPGTMFLAGTGIQNMVVIKREVVLLLPNSNKTINIDAACMNMHLDVPGTTDSFGIGTTPIPDDLIKLLALEDFSQSTFRVQQFAIWTITDNPKRNDYVGIGSFGIGFGPDDEEIAAIKELFQKAGISISKYQALV